MRLLLPVTLPAFLGLLTAPSTSAQEPELRATLKGQIGPVISLAFSPDGKTLASGSSGRDDQVVGRADGQGAGHPQGAHQPRVVRGVQPGRQDAGLGERRRSVSHAGRQARLGEWGPTIKLWDVQTGKERATLKGHTGPVLSVAFSPDGKTLASGSHDKTVKLWDVTDGQGAGHPQGAHRPGDVRGVQPGRQDAGLGECGQDDQAVGRADGQGAGHPQGAHEFIGSCGPWRSARTARRWPRGAMTRRSSSGTRRRARSGPPSRGTRSPVYVRGVQPGRQDAGLGEP